MAQVHTPTAWVHLQEAPPPSDRSDLPAGDADALVPMNDEVSALWAEANADSPAIVLARLRETRARQTARDTALSGQPSGSIGMEGCSGTPRRAGLCGADVQLFARVSYEADLWGRLERDVQAAELDAEGAAADLRAARRLLKANVLDSYWSVAGLQATALHLERQRDAEQALVSIAADRVALGAALGTELDNARSRHANVLARIATVRRQQDVREQDLRVFLGRAELVRVAAQSLPGEAPPRWTAVGTPAQTLERRPDVWRARREVDAALLRVGVADAGRYPRLAFTGTLQRGTGGATDWITQPLATLVATLSVPIIEWQRIELRRQAARTDLEAAVASLRDTLTVASADIESLAAERQELVNLQATQQQLVLDALRAEAQARLRLSEGAGSRRDWLLTVSALASAQADEATVRLAAWRNHIQLLRAVATL